MAKEISGLSDLVDLTNQINKVREEFVARYAGMPHEERVERMLLDIMSMLYVELYVR
jgi:hypothetical protein